MTRIKSLHPDTVCLHGGQEPDNSTGSMAVPIHQTSSFVFKNTEHAAAMFKLEQSGYIYSRVSNPTAEVVEKRVTELEGGKGGLLLASGLAAETITLTTLAKQGENIVSSTNLYGGTSNLLKNALPRFGITTRFADIKNPAAFAAQIDLNTRAIYVETIGNPSGEVADLVTLADIAHKNHLPLVVDNTFASPYLCRPFDWGADIIVHSATKFIGGHGTSIGGIIIDSGRFPWESGRFPDFVAPSPAFHGLNLREAFGTEVFITKCRMEGMRTLGPSPAPFNAFLFLQGLETLHLRMPRHCENAIQVARFLSGHEKVAWVNYAGLADHSSFALAEKYLPQGAGAIFTFGVKGGIKAGKKLIENLELISFLANVGDARTLILHPASTTHSQLTEAEQLEAGVTPDQIRISIGLEYAADIIKDLEQALETI